MPRFNGQGPRGEGSMTGRKMGRCNSAVRQNSDEKSNNNDVASLPQNGVTISNQGRGLGLGLGMRMGGRGRGRGGLNH
ncbi:MAG: DUF5320 domain-containing protein [Bacteroidales bacterium]|nr:DUF5320 domain-containing protein [Bacteroidales bacterium]MDD4822730.1 DUF5320 domain-containing protein [Bacteroidales bacterium]